MAEYYAVLSKAVAGLEPGAAEARRAVYDKARNALIGQLKAIDPPLPTAEISRQRLELEEAIRRVEREASTGTSSSGSVGRATPPPRPAATPTAPPQAPVEEAAAAATDAGSSPQGIFRRAIQEAEARSGTSPRRERPPAPARVEPAELAADEDYVHDEEATYVEADAGYRRPEPERLPPRDRPAYLNEPHHANDRRSTAPHLAPDYDYDYDQAQDRAYDQRSNRRTRPYPAEPYLDERDQPAKAKRRRRGYVEKEEPSFEDEDKRRSRLPTMILLVLIVGMVGALAVLAYSQRQVLSEVLASFDSGGVSSPSSPAPDLATPEVETSLKNSDRLLEGEPANTGVRVLDTDAGNSAGAAAPDLAEADTMAEAPAAAGGSQGAMLYEEPLDPEAAASGVTAIQATAEWSFVPNGANGPEVIANLDIPERNTKIRLSIRRNTDPALPASHLVEIITDTPTGFPGGGVNSIPRLVLKPAEDARGQPLVGAAAKVADGFFWIALSAVDADVAANLDLLETREWIDLPMVYDNGQRAILTFQKGAAGDDALNQAIAAWNVG